MEIRTEFFSKSVTLWRIVSRLPCGYPYKLEVRPWRIELKIVLSRLLCGQLSVGYYPLGILTNWSFILGIQIENCSKSVTLWTFVSRLPCVYHYKLELHPWRFEPKIVLSRLLCGQLKVGYPAGTLTNWSFGLGGSNWKYF